jgi:hypothetical protein
MRHSRGWPYLWENGSQPCLAFTTPTGAEVSRSLACDYHVFVTAEGDSNGLYVSARTPREFEVREQGGGASTLTFSYRVVVRPKDVEPERLQVFKPPRELPAEPEPEEPALLTEWKDCNEQSK